MNLAQREEYLSYTSLSERLDCSVGHVRNLVYGGHLIEGVHFTRAGTGNPKGRKGRGHPRFKWSAVQAWLDSGGELPQRRRKSA